MINASLALLRTSSKRIPVRLVSSAQTGYFYMTEKSPSKADTVLTLRKHDPVVNAHVLFVEQKQEKQNQNKKQLTKPGIRNMRLTGKRIDHLVTLREKKEKQLVVKLGVSL